MENTFRIQIQTSDRLARERPRQHRTPLMGRDLPRAKRRGEGRKFHGEFARDTQELLRQTIPSRAILWQTGKISGDLSTIGAKGSEMRGSGDIRQVIFTQSQRLAEKLEDIRQKLRQCILDAAADKSWQLAAKFPVGSRVVNPLIRRRRCKLIARSASSLITDSIPFQHTAKSRHSTFLPWEKTENRDGLHSRRLIHTRSVTISCQILYAKSYSQSPCYFDTGCPPPIPQAKFEGRPPEWAARRWCGGLAEASPPFIFSAA